MIQAAQVPEVGNMKRSPLHSALSLVLLAALTASAQDEASSPSFQRAGSRLLMRVVG